MVLGTLPMTAEQFDEWVDQPEQAEQEGVRFEFIAGEIHEVASNAFASKISALMLFFILRFVMERKLGHVTGEAGGYRVSGYRFAPDVAYISYARQRDLDRDGYNRLAPDLAVEVEYPVSAASERRLRQKIRAYMSAGTVVWVIYPEVQEIVVYLPGQPAVTLTIDDMLDGGAILPGFSLPVRDVFAETTPEASP